MSLRLGLDPLFQCAETQIELKGTSMYVYRAVKLVVTSAVTVLVD